MKMEKLRIITKKGRVITLDVTHKTETHIIGNDKFGETIVLSYDKIDDCFPISGGLALIDKAVAASGWSNDFNGVVNASISKINGIALASIAKVNGV